MENAPRKVILIRRALGGAGGAERVFRKYTAALAGEWEVVPVSEAPGSKGSSVERAQNFAGWADEIVAQHAGAVSFSLERGVSADVFRAGDGVHKEYVKQMGGFSFNPIHRVYPQLDEKSFRAARVIIANSQMVAGQIAEHYPWAAAKVRVVRNGIDLKKFAVSEEPKEKIRERLKLPEGKLFLFMGNGWRRKGLKQALEIAKKCAAQLAVVGKGRESELKGLGVIYRGEVDNMPDYYRACEAFVLPTCYDPFTSSVVEALSCGVPVVTTAQNGAAEVVQHGVTGFILPLQNKNLKEAAQWLMKNNFDAKIISESAAGCTVEREMAAIKEILSEAGVKEKMPAAVCLIVKNEADRLEKTLAPWHGRVAEMLAWDSGSNDGTIEILKNHGVSVMEGPWMGFSQTRRTLWTMPESPWIVWLDADEVFAPETLEALAKWLRENPDPTKSEIKGFRICRQVVFEGRKIMHGEWGRDWVLRIFPREAFAMEARQVHESVSVMGRVIDLPGCVEHHSFRNWNDLEARSERYAALWAQQAFAAGKRPGVPLMRAAWKFVKGYLLKWGWRDGALGYKIALHNAKEVYAKHTQLQNLYRKPAVERI